MDLLRLDTVEFGPLYVTADAIKSLFRDGENTCISIIRGHVGVDVTILGDVDEVAAALESCYHACRLYRVT